MSAPPVIDILMYHSISDAGGPTSIPPAVFDSQMAEIARAQVPVVTLDDLVAAHGLGQPLPPHSVIITFDDAYQDFADAALPVLQRHGFPATVYLPTEFIGREEAWDGANSPPRRLMDWGTIRALAADGVTFGSHSVTHSDLTMLADETLHVELNVSKAEIEDQLGRSVRHFAPPYGMSNDHVTNLAAGVYDTAAGTRLDRATVVDNLLDLPRIEMFYFTDPARWADHLAGNGAGYLARRKAMRWIGRRLPSL